MAIEIKLATTVEEQLVRLKERGMSIDNEDFVNQGVSPSVDFIKRKQDQIYNLC